MCLSLTAEDWLLDHRKMWCFEGECLLASLPKLCFALIYDIKIIMTSYDDKMLPLFLTCRWAAKEQTAAENRLAALSSFSQLPGNMMREGQFSYT